MMWHLYPVRKLMFLLLLIPILFLSSCGQDAGTDSAAQGAAGARPGIKTREYALADTNACALLIRYLEKKTAPGPAPTGTDLPDMHALEVACLTPQSEKKQTVVEVIDHRGRLNPELIRTLKFDPATNTILQPPEHRQGKAKVFGEVDAGAFRLCFVDRPSCDVMFTGIYISKYTHETPFDGLAEDETGQELKVRLRFNGP